MVEKFDVKDAKKGNFNKQMGFRKKFIETNSPLLIRNESKHVMDDVMAKIDYSKAEREFGDAVQHTRIKDLAEGKPAPTERAIEYFGLQEKTPRPIIDDSVGKLLSEEAASNEQEADGVVEEIEEEPIICSVEKTPDVDVLYKARKKSKRVPQKIQPPSSAIGVGADQFLEVISPLLVLRKNILWLKHQHIDNRYELLGTTLEEVNEFKNAERLTPEQIQRINHINVLADEVKTQILIKLGSETDETLIEKEKNLHRRKRFNVKDSWIPL